MPTDPEHAEFTGASQGQRYAGQGVLEFVTADGEHVALQLEEDDLAEVYNALHSWGVWMDAEAVLEDHARG